MAEKQGSNISDAVAKAREQRVAKMTRAETPARLTLEQTRSARESSKSAASAPVPAMMGNQYFKVSFGSTVISFARVSNVQRSVEHETLTEGGLNGYVHVLTKPGSQGGTLTLEKGIAADGETGKLMKSLAPGRRISVPVTVSLCRREGKAWTAVRSWGFEDGMITRWELTNLDGLGSEIAIEKLEITHAGMSEVEV